MKTYRITAVIEAWSPPLDTAAKAQDVCAAALGLVPGVNALVECQAQDVTERQTTELSLTPEQVRNVIEWIALGDSAVAKASVVPALARDYLILHARCERQKPQEEGK